MDYSIDPWLGDTPATDEQRQALQAASDAIDARWPDQDDADTREQALIGAALIILGDDTLDAIGRQHTAAQREADEARARLAGAVIASEGSMSEVQLGTTAGVTRKTIRSWLGR